MYVTLFNEGQARAKFTNHDQTNLTMNTLTSIDQRKVAEVMEK